MSPGVFSIKNFGSQARRVILLLLIGWLISGIGPAIAQPVVEINQLKAVWLFRFFQFTHWPPEAFSSQTSPFIIAIVGDDPFGNALHEVLKGETMEGRPFSVQYFKRHEDAAKAHLVFISSSVKVPIKTITDSFKGLPVLTVSDQEGFTDRGGIIGFFTEGNLLRFDINLIAAQENKLVIRSQLLQRAARVLEKKK